MTRYFPVWFLLCVMGFLFFNRCRPKQPAQGIESTEKKVDPIRISSNGKKKNHPIQHEVYHPIPLGSVPVPLITPPIVKALKQQMQLLDYFRPKKYRLASDLTVEHIDLIKTVHLLLSWQQTHPIGLNNELQLYRLQGEDQKTNVKFTGYYSPVVNVSKTPTSTFRYPMYKRPRDWEGPLPTRRAIEKDNIFDTLGVTIAWADNKFDIYSMQIQGSGYVKYPNGSLSFFSYDGTNRHPYRSMEKFLRGWDGPKPTLYTWNGIQQFFKEYPHMVDTVLFQNPSYTFFKPSYGKSRGAGSVELTPEMSIAVDRRFIPLGSCLLAAVPIYDHQRKKVISHEYRLLFAQDVGGVIKGPGHIDLYMGTGHTAQEKARSLRHYGQLYLILPKK